MYLMAIITTSDTYCTQCGKKNIPIPRKQGRAREGGHLKKMYCLHCQQQTNMVEIRGFGDYTLEDFELEYEYHNFNKDGTRKLSLGEFRTHLNNGGGILK